MPTLNEALGDTNLRRQIHMAAVENREARLMLRFVDRADRNIVDRIRALDPNSVADRFKRRRLERLLEDLRVIGKRLDEQLKGSLATRLPPIGMAEATFQAETFQKLIKPTGLFFGDRVTPAMVKAAALSRPFQSVHLRWATAAEHVTEFTRRRNAMLRDTIRFGVLTGQSNSEMVRAIRGTSTLNFQDGLLNVSHRTAETIVRTAVNHTQNAARMVFYEEQQELIKGLRWLATLDARTCPICAARDRQSAEKPYPVDSGPRPPAHPNCRCSMVPILKSFRDLGLDVEDPPILQQLARGDTPATEGFQTWLKRQPVNIQETVLGKTKARLFRQGGLTVDRFINRRGQELTLDQLRKLEPEAFVAAGLDPDAAAA